MVEHMLSTVDNPYNPFYQFDEWLAWDTAQGYHTNSFLARIIKTSDDLTEADESAALEDAIDEIVQENILGLYIKVTADDKAPRIAPLPRASNGS
jgi:hypothetical protein